MSDITWTDYSARLAAHNPVVLLPIGSLEQHGPHSPLGSDEINGRLIAIEVAKRAGGLVAPSLNYGCRSQPRTGGGNHFPGTTSLRGETMVMMVIDIICELARHGVRKILIMDSHYENEWFIIEGINLAMDQLRASGADLPKVVKVRYFELLPPEVIDLVFPEGFPGWPLEHAGVMTTSLHLHLTPNLVDMSQAPLHGPIAFPPYDVFPHDPETGTQTGCLNSPSTATALKGKAVFEASVEQLVHLIEHEFLN
jgi:creatinine amidohydrolase